MASLSDTQPTSKRRRSKRPHIQYGDEPAYVVLKSQSDSKPPRTSSVSLRELVQSRCPSLASKYRPPWLLNGHLQTIYSVLGDFSKVDQVWYQRRLLRLLDGGTLGLDFTPPDASTVPNDAPIIVVQHGLTGGSHEPYVRAILAPACAPVERGGLGYRAVVVNFRGCSGVPITSPKFYTAAQTDDLRQALLFISTLYPNAPLLGLGFSIGGNVLVRYLAEEGVDSRLSAACILGCPWDLKTNNDCLLRGTLGKRVYLRGMGENVTALLRRHQDAFLQDPDHPAAAALQTVLRLKHPTLTDVDRLFTCAAGAAPPFPFASVHAYYAWASSHALAARIRVPCLTINARDDPVVQRVQVPAAARGSGHVVAVLTAAGGHLAWFTRRRGRPRARWTTAPVLEWLRVFGADVVRDPVGGPAARGADGYLREARWPHLGCREVPGGGVVDGNRPERELFQGL